MLGLAAVVVGVALSSYIVVILWFDFAPELLFFLSLSLTMIFAFIEIYKNLCECCEQHETFIHNSNLTFD